MDRIYNNCFLFICFSSGATKALTINSSNLSSCKCKCSTYRLQHAYTMLAVHQDILCHFCLKRHDFVFQRFTCNQPTMRTTLLWH